MAAARNINLWRQLFFLAVGPLLCFIFVNMPPLEGLTEFGMTCLGACSWLLCWWITEVLPLPATSLMSIPIFTFLGIMDPGKVFAFIGHPAMMLIFGATLIVGVWKESNLIERYAYWCFNLPFIRSNPLRMVFVFAMGAGLMSAIAPNIPLVILFISISVAIIKSCNLSPDNNFTRSLCTLSAMAPMFGGMGTPLGGAPNIIAIAIVSTTLGHDITFWEWSALGMPLCVLIMLFCCAITLIIFPLGKSSVSIPQDYMKKKMESLGPITMYEHVAIWIMVIALVMWCAGPQIFAFFGAEALGRKMNAPVVAVLMGVAAFIVPIKRDKENGRLVFALNWEQAVRNIGWAIIVLQIGAVAFGQVLLDGGVDKWAAQGIQNILGDVPSVYVWCALVILTGFLSQIILSIAIIPLMIPITVGLAQLYGFDPLLACLSVAFVSNLTTMFPFSSVAVAIVLTSSEGYAQSKDFIMSGFLNTVAITVLTFAFCYFVGPMILG